MLDVRTQDVTIISNSTGEDVTEQYALLMTQDEKERKDKQQKERDKKRLIKDYVKTKEGILL